LRRETTRALTKAVLAADWKPTVPAKLPEIAAAIEEMESALPLKQFEPALDGQTSRLIEDHLRPIGAKIDPRISAEQAQAWRKAMLLALSDLPSAVVLRSVREAVHRPYQFLNEVEAAVREIAAVHMENRRLALVRLKRWHAELERAAMPQPQLEAPAEDPPIEQEEVDALNATLRGAGVATRFGRDEAGKLTMITPASDKRRAENGAI
jgi:hypothetical protein